MSIIYDKNTVAQRASLPPAPGNCKSNPLSPPSSACVHYKFISEDPFLPGTA